jgi:tetratricopeptide (TPR) repeat protein
MRRIVWTAVALLFTVSLSAQTTAQEYISRYNLLVGKLGLDGVGIETLVNKWEADYPDDVDMLCAKYNYYFTKCQRNEVVSKAQDRFLGAEPVLSLKDSTGTKVNYFTEVFYDDEMYGLASQALDKAIRLRPDDIGLRFSKITSLLAYEKESPDMATQALRSLIDYQGSSHPKWNYAGEPFTEDDFKASMTEYCYALFRTGSPTSSEAFKSVSEKMLSYYPKDTNFLNNLGSYYLVCKKDYKTAQKYYAKTLKLDPDNYPAIRNCVILSRKTGNAKMEKKYLQMLARVSPDETERNSAKIRLEALK